MSEDKLKELQDAQDNRPQWPTDEEIRSEGVQAFAYQSKKWFEDFTRKFAAYRAELELPGEWLTKNAKTYEVACFNCNGWGHSKDGNICSHCNGIGKVEAISVDEIQRRLNNDRKQLSDHFKKFPFQRHECPNISKYWCERDEEGVHYTCSQKQHCDWLKDLKELLEG